MNLKRLEFTLTTKCNSQCLHCQAEASPRKDDVMEVEGAYDYLEEATSVAKLESFMVFGGEPMLYPERAIAMFRKASELEIPEIEMLTNGVWGKTRENAEKLAIELENAGLNDVGISVDAFHSRYTPLEYPKNAASALVKAGVKKVNWNVTVVESINATNEYDRETRRILEALEPVGIEAHIHTIIPVGRATQNLRQYLRRKPLDGSCEGDAVLGNVLTSPTSICIEPSGEVDVCWRLPIGNAKEKPLSKIISGYDWRKNPTIRILVEEGPMGLLRYAGEGTDKLAMNNYVDRCHLCIETRKRLSVPKGAQ